MDVSDWNDEKAMAVHQHRIYFSVTALAPYSFCASDKLSIQNQIHVFSLWSEKKKRMVLCQRKSPCVLSTSIQGMGGGGGGGGGKGDYNSHSININ